MQLDPALATVPAVAVEGKSVILWKRHLRFGGWQTTAVKDSGTKVSRQGMGPASHEMYGREYRFSMATGNGTIEAWCSQFADVAKHQDVIGVTVGIDLAGLRKSPPLQCIYDGLGGGKLKLLKEPARDLPIVLDGDAEFAGVVWRVNEVYRMEGGRSSSLAPLSGFEIRRDGEVIGAVEVINAGRVWVTPSLPRLEQDRVAVIAMSLLLFDPYTPLPGDS